MNDGRRQECHASKQTQYSLCFPTFKGIMPHKYLPVGQTVKHYSYKDVLESLRGKEPSQKREAMVPRMGSSGLISKAIFHPPPKITRPIRQISFIVNLYVYKTIFS